MSAHARCAPTFAPPRPSYNKRWNGREHSGGECPLTLLQLLPHKKKELL